MKIAPIPSPIYDSYWRFAALRQDILFNRLAGRQPWASDKILQEFKFTNCYRASDRVSQYLIREVIYKQEYSLQNTFFRIMLFKLFNKIETWQLLEKVFGELYYSERNCIHYSGILSEAMERGERIYSAAYIMPAAKQYGTGAKHISHLKLLDTMMKDDLPQRIFRTPKMEMAFNLLRSYPSIGDFLAYQYVTDLNYSTLTGFSEMEFVVPGPGALDGIHKCFSSLGSYDETEIIKLMTHYQDYEFDRLKLNFQSLFGRKLQLIDCQNLFCEFSKYSRQAFPEVTGVNGRTKIKQLFKPNSKPYKLFFPPKWNINEAIVQWYEANQSKS